MVSFKEWCSAKFGITRMTAGKIDKRYFAFMHENPILNALANYSRTAPYLGSISYNKGYPGYYLTKSSFSALSLILAGRKLRLNVYYYNNPSSFYFKITAAKEKDFLLRFADFNPMVSWDPLNEENAVQASSALVDVLYLQYWAENKKEEEAAAEKQLKIFKLIEHVISYNQLLPALDKAHFLSLDYDNLNYTAFEATRAYALSLRLFTEIKRPLLSLNEYHNLLHAVTLLAAYDEQGIVQQSLQTDSNFMTNLVYVIGQRRFPYYKADRSFPLISELKNGYNITQAIHKNALALLYGSVAVLPGGKKWQIRRFLPDKAMQSETNEIIMQAGGMLTHFALVRLIKVGMLANGDRAEGQVKADYFNYFKVEVNLGTGCHDPDFAQGTCIGTHITQLQPTIISADKRITITTTNPLTDPLLYQEQMENTLIELIKTEREISFYRNPPLPGIREGLTSPEHSTEALEWVRLSHRRKQLSGVAQTTPISYVTEMVPGIKIVSQINNQKGYFQEGGSCLIFSLKQLVTSIIGHELTSLHSHFLQTHNGLQHLQAIQEKIKALIPTGLGQKYPSHSFFAVPQSTMTNEMDKTAVSPN